MKTKKEPPRRRRRGGAAVGGALAMTHPPETATCDRTECVSKKCQEKKEEGVQIKHAGPV